MKIRIIFLACMIVFAGSIVSCQSIPPSASATDNPTPTLASTPGSTVEPAVADYQHPEGNMCDAESYDFGDFYCKDGELHIVQKGLGSVAGWADGKYKNFMVQAQMRLSGEKGAYGVEFRAVDKAFYVFEIHPDGKYQLIQWNSGRITVLIPWTAATAIKQGEAVNLLEVMAQGPRLTLFANGQQLASISDETFPEGGAGPIALEQGHTIIDTVKIWQLP